MRSLHAEGIPDKSEYGDISNLSPGGISKFIVQKHEARRAGTHYDVRLGDKNTGLLSWSSRKDLPDVGEKRLLVRQPLHSFDYKDFEGEIESGYGAGKVSKHRENNVLIDRVTDSSVVFTVSDERMPERFAIVRTGKGTKNERWLMINVTPRGPIPVSKIKFMPIPPAKGREILENFQPGTTVQAKIDGASNIIQLLNDRIELISYRKSKNSDNQIVYTEKFLGSIPKVRIPKDLVGTILHGELYGVKGKKAIRAAELGGLLNATIENSLSKQRGSKINLKNMVFDISKLGKKDVSNVPYNEKLKMITKVIKYLPAGDKWEIPETISSKDEALRLFKQIQSGKHPLTDEGIIIRQPGEKPKKVKFFEEFDVYIRRIFPGSGKYENSAGGFEYSLTPDGPIVGKVGTGFDDEFRQELWENSDLYIGRVARIKARGQNDSGAYREPVFLALHEDYPMKEVQKSGEFVMSLASRFIKTALARVSGGNSIFRGFSDPGLYGQTADAMPTQTETSGTRSDYTSQDYANRQHQSPGQQPTQNSNVQPGPAIDLPDDLKGVPVLEALKRAKYESDRGNYEEKNRIMRAIITAYPDEFYIDSEFGKYYGITHKRTNFRIHVPKELVDDILEVPEHLRKVKGRNRSVVSRLLGI